MTIVTNPSTVQTTVSFYKAPADGQPAWGNINADPVTGKRDGNYTLESHEIKVENIRGREDTVTLDTAGFQFYSNHPAAHKSFNNDEEIEKEYYPESIELIKELTGASRVVLFDHSKLFVREVLTTD